ncbi:MAG: FAD-dependent oxidoreductase, partial [Candidatus Omnitrophica bacterium]|nr:FAD-dependent oxidoreductase [Candidatus Omnitrophota bacterium]
SLEYDFLVIASGSETNFYGNQNIEEGAYALDSVADAARIRAVLKEKEFKNFIISGGGYTGVEVVTNLRLFLEKNKRDGRIIIVERSPSILGPLPAWIKDYVNANLKHLNIELLPNSAIEKIEGERVFVSGQKTFEQALVIWAAGVKTASFIQNLAAEKNPQGRIRTDEYLRLNEHCFVIGDAAYFSYHNTFLRMAVQFAIFQGYCAAGNIINTIKGKKLKKYRPLDLGYIIPMANNRSCGEVLGVKFRGKLPTLFHFLMCLYRSYSLKNKIGIVKNLLKGG